MRWLDVAFLGCLTYVIVETVMLPIAAARKRDVRGRIVTYLVVLIAAVVLGLLLVARDGS